MARVRNSYHQDISWGHTCNTNNTGFRYFVLVLEFCLQIRNNFFKLYNIKEEEMMATEKEETDMLTLSGSYRDLYGDEENEETPKTAGVIAEWGEVNRKLRHHGYQPVMVLPFSRLQHIPGGAVVLEEFTSKNLRYTLEKLMADCDRRQSMVQELITSSHRIQSDADEERNRVYHYEMEIRNLQRELQEEKLKTQEMERVRLVELQHHGKEVQELKRGKAELVLLYAQMEQKVTQKEAEITRLQHKCQELIEAEGKRLERQSKVAKHFQTFNSPYKHETVDQKLLDAIDNYESQLSKTQPDHLMKNETESCNSLRDGTSQSDSSEDTPPLEGASGEKCTKDANAVVTPRMNEVKLLATEKQLRDSKKLIKLLESENTHLKLELESRPNRDELKNARRYNKQLEKLLAQNNLSPPHKKHREKRSREIELHSASRPWRHSTNIGDIDFLPIDVCREHLKKVCNRLQVNDLKDIQDKINTMKVTVQSHPAMEELIRDIMDVVNSKDSPKLSVDVLSQSAVSHEVHCERAWQNIVPVLKMWLKELAGLKGSKKHTLTVLVLLDLQVSIKQLSFRLMPWKTASLLQEDHGLLTVQRLKAAVDALSQDKRASPSELRTEEEPSLGQLQSFVAHFQKLFDVNSIDGIFPRMNEIYMRLGETINSMNNMRDILDLEPACKASDLVNAVAKLSKAKHLLTVEDLPGIIKRLDQYDEFFPAFQSLVSELKRLLRVQEMDEIITAVTALVKFPPY